MESSPLARAAQQLVVGVGRERQINSVNVACVTIMILEWFLTFDLEFSLVWKAKWNPTKIMYLLARYLPFIDTSLVIYRHLAFTLSKGTCQRVFECIVFMFGFGMGTVEMIFTLRTWAVWGKSKCLTWGIFSTFAATWAAIFVTLVLYVRSVNQEVSPAPQVIGCTLRISSPVLSVSFILLMAYDAALLIMMLIRGVSAFRSGGDSYLTRVVYSDGIVYYVYVFLLSLLNVLIILKLPDDYETLLLTMERVIHSVLACRVVLHIRQQGAIATAGRFPIANSVEMNHLDRHVKEPKGSDRTID
ncbi:hypothetical protein P691DRAFT_67697 [Macrolepiota fuliginosa MF-IS2]|uniref:DUF6533 domain-containing protein n=1 Tax=Macrolepiota fuliginosa MF-IS2 TaxID=1400762 RepID=A0A9P5XF68_9AGAR|nr:hypothetical protein P691DRAFT_67697 [Macrolepiota fuliginosa MF-IS2]